MPFRLPFRMPLRLPFRMRLGGSALMHERRPGTAGNAARAGAGRIGLFGRRRAAPADANADPRLLELESWYRGVRPWLLPREEDCTLIVPPSSVYKLSGSAFPLMNWLDSGRSLGEIPGLDRAKIADLEVFFDQLQAAYEGRAPRLSQGFGRTPYDFAFTGLPVLGELAVTYRCNERCAFCYAGCGEAGCGGAGDTGAAGEPGGEMTLPGAKRIIDIFRHEAKIPFFSFTGGEPLLRDDLEAMAEYAHSLGLRTNLITNGTLATPRRAASLYAAGLRTAQVSLESPDPDTHDGLCGVPGAWERTVAGIHALREAGFSVQTNSTLTAINSESLERLPGFLASIGVRRFSMNLFIPSGRGRSSGQLAVRYTDTGPFVEATSRRARAAGLDFFWYSPTPYCLFNPVAKGLGHKS